MPLPEITNKVYRGASVELLYQGERAILMAAFGGDERQYILCSARLAIDIHKHFDALGTYTKEHLALGLARGLLWLAINPTTWETLSATPAADPIRAIRVIRVGRDTIEAGYYRLYMIPQWGSR
jgi:hypothetical protein